MTEPDHSADNTQGGISLDNLAMQAQEVLDGTSDDVLAELIALNGSSESGPFNQNTIAATILPMRRLFMIFLLVLMPLQLSWAAMASYCQHETGAAAKHFGHHDHQHKAADGKDAAPDPAKTGGGDPDCASCHAGGTSVLADALTIHLVADSSLGTADHRARLTSPPFERIERPQWRVLA